MTLEQRLGRALAMLGLLGIVVTTLTPQPDAAAAAAMTSFWCLICGGLGGIDVTLNVILFIPFALGLRLSGVSFRRTVLAAVCLTVFVEGMQATVIAGRDSSISDILTNTMGGILGALIAPRLRRLIQPNRTTAPVLAIVWGAVWLAIIAGTAWLLQPWRPGTPLQAVWVARLPSYRAFTGRVLRVEVDHVPLDPGPVPDSAGIASRLATGQVALGLGVIVGPPGSHWAPIFALLDSRGNGSGTVFDVRNNLVLQLPTNAERLLLRSPAIRLDGGRPSAGNELVRIAGGTRGRTLWLASSFGAQRRSYEVALSPSFGWSLLLPWEYAYGREVHFLTALWIAGLLFPLGYWLRWARAPGWRPESILFGLAAVVGVGLGAIPWLGGFAPVHPSEWLAAIIGLAGGWAAARWVAYLAGRCASPSASESCSS